MSPIRIDGKVVLIAPQSSQDSDLGVRTQYCGRSLVPVMLRLLLPFASACLAIPNSFLLILLRSLGKSIAPSRAAVVTDV